MNRYCITYPQNKINIIDQDWFVKIFLKFTHGRESYLIFHRYHKIEPNLLMLQLRDKEILLYSTLLLALDQFNKGVYKYKVPLNIPKKRLNKKVSNKKIGLLTICMFPDEFYYETYVGDKVLNLIREKLPVIFLNF